MGLVLGLLFARATRTNTQPLLAWQGGIEAHRKRGGTAKRVNAGDDRANDGVRKGDGRYIGDGIDRATHRSPPLALAAHSAKKEQNERNGNWPPIISAAQ
jgi:hypothetical protein